MADDPNLWREGRRPAHGVSPEAEPGCQRSRRKDSGALTAVS